MVRLTHAAIERRNGSMTGFHGVNRQICRRGELSEIIKRCGCRRGKREGVNGRDEESVSVSTSVSQVGG